MSGSPFGKPLAPTVYLKRNAARIAPLFLVIVLAVLLISGIVTMMNSIPLSIRTIYSYSKEFMGALSRGDATLTPQLRSQIESQAPVPVERLIECRGAPISVISIVGKWRFAVLGLHDHDIPYFLDRMGAQNMRGRLPEPGKPEVVVSENIARNLRLQIGDALLSPEDSENYSPFEVKVVGIADAHRWFAVTSYEYLAENHFPPIDSLLVFARTESEQRQLESWALEAFKGQRAEILAWSKLEEETNDMFKILYQILNLVIASLVVLVSLMMGLLINIYQNQRTVEYGLLQAIGYTKKRLVARALTETALILIGSWVLGAAIAFGLLNFVEKRLFYPRAFMLDPTDVGAYLYTLPVPLAILLVATVTVIGRFRRFDPVAIVERRLV